MGVSYRPDEDPRLKRLRRLLPPEDFMRAQQDATAAPVAIRPQPTIGPQPAEGLSTVDRVEAPSRPLRERVTTKLSRTPLGARAAEVITGEGAFAPDKPVGFALDVANVPGAIRAGFMGAEMAEQGHPLIGAGVAAAGSLPFIGPSGRKVGKKLATEMGEATAKKLLSPEQFQAARPSIAEWEDKAASSLTDALPDAPGIKGTATREGLQPRPGFMRLGPEKVEGTGTPYKAPIDDGQDPRLANLRKLNLSPEAEQSVRDSYTRLDLDKKVVTHEETKAVADELGLDVSRVMRAHGRMSGAQLLAVRDAISQNAHRMTDVAKQARDASLPAAEREAAQAEVRRLTHQTDELLSRYSTERSRAGRDLNALRIVARNTMEPSVWLSQAERVKQGVPLTGDEMAEITALATKNDRDGLIRYVSGLHKSGLGEQAVHAWKAGLLTSLASTGANMAGNIGHEAFIRATEPAAVAVDAIISAMRGTERTKALSGKALRTMELSQGWRDFKRTIRHGATPDELAKWDFRKVNYGDSRAGRILQGYTDGVFNFMGAQDKLVAAAAVGRSIEERIAVKIANIRKKHGDAAAEAELARLRSEGPDPDMTIAAIEDSMLVTFQDENVVAKAVSAGKRQLVEKGATLAHSATELTAPFVKTPTNVVARGLDYSPVVGLVRALRRNAKNPNQKRLAEDLARNMTATGVVAAGFWAAAEGMITGPAPTDADERRVWDERNLSPNAAKLGDRSINLPRTLGPAGMMLAVGAHMYHASKNAETPVGAVAAGLYAPARVALDQSFLKGVSGVLEAANDPARAGGYLAESTVGSVVPAGVAAVARGLDPVIRDDRGNLGLNRVRARTPLASRDLPARVTPLGRDRTRHGGGPLGVAKEVLDFTQSREIVPQGANPVLDEIERLGVTIPQVGKTYKRQGETVRRTPEDIRSATRVLGPLAQREIASLMRDASYQRAPDDIKAQMVERVLNTASRYAKAQEQQRQQPAQVVRRQPR